MIPTMLISVAKIFLIILTLLFLALYFYFKKQYKYWKVKNVPHTKPTFPLGNLTGVIGNSSVDVFKKIYDESKHQRYYGIWLLHKPVLMINDPDLIKKILIENFADFHSTGTAFDTVSDRLLKETLFSLDGPKWKNFRAKLSPIFSSGKLKAFFPLIVKCSQDLQDVLEESAKSNDIIDCRDLSTRYLSDALSTISFGVELDQIKNPDNENAKMMDKFFPSNITFLIKFFVVIHIPQLARMFKLSLNPKEAEDYFIKIIEDVVDFRQKNNFSRNDAMQLLLELLNKGYIEDVNSADKVDRNKEKFTLENLLCQALGFFLVGHDSATLVMQWASYELAMNPEIQKNLRKEIRTVLANHNGEITYEAVAEMDYLTRVIDETLRKYPFSAVGNRKCTDQYKDPSSDLVIEKDTTVLIPVFGLHYDERYYPDPEKFDPDRFTVKNKSSRPHCAYLPFGEGPRNCIGKRLGLLLIKVGLIAFLCKFQLKTSERFTPKTIKFDPKSIFCAPKDKIMLEISFCSSAKSKI